MVDTMLIVIGAVIAVGVVAALPQSSAIYGSSKLASWGESRKMLFGLNIVCFGGLLASTWTVIIKRDLIASGASDSCSAAGCSSLIGGEYSSVPLIGLDWGVLGLGAFTLLGFIALSLLLDSKSDWKRNWLNIGFLASAAGLPMVLWLVAVELVIADDAPIICPYCTMAHIATVVSFIFFLMLRKANDEGRWKA